MGAWGPQPFANDTALDWLRSLQHGGLRAIERSIYALRASKRHLGAPACEEAAAAAESLCVLIGKPGGPVPSEVREWAAREKERPLPQLMKEAAAGIDAMLVQSELKARWDESAEGARWRAGLQHIRQRLLGHNPP
jgi:hypothetical protein